MTDSLSEMVRNGTCVCQLGLSAFPIKKGLDSFIYKQACFYYNSARFCRKGINLKEMHFYCVHGLLNESDIPISKQQLTWKMGDNAAEIYTKYCTQVSDRYLTYYDGTNSFEKVKRKGQNWLRLIRLYKFPELGFFLLKNANGDYNCPYNNNDREKITSYDYYCQDIFCNSEAAARIRMNKNNTEWLFLVYWKQSSMRVAHAPDNRALVTHVQYVENRLVQKIIVYYDWARGDIALWMPGVNCYEADDHIFSIVEGTCRTAEVWPLIDVPNCRNETEIVNFTNTLVPQTLIACSLTEANYYEIMNNKSIKLNKYVENIIVNSFFIESQSKYYLHCYEYYNMRLISDYSKAVAVNFFTGVCSTKAVRTDEGDIIYNSTIDMRNQKTRRLGDYISLSILSLFSQEGRCYFEKDSAACFCRAILDTQTDTITPCNDLSLIKTATRVVILNTLSFATVHSKGSLREKYCMLEHECKTESIIKLADCISNPATKLYEMLCKLKLNSCFSHGTKVYCCVQSGNAYAKKNAYDDIEEFCESSNSVELLL